MRVSISFPRDTEVFEFEARVAREVLLPIAGEKIRRHIRSRIFGSIACALQTGSFRALQKLARRLFDRIRFIQNDDGILAQAEQRMHSRNAIVRLPRMISVSELKTVGRFQKRWKRYAVDGTHRTLRIGVELAQGLDGIAEKFQAHGAFRFGWEYVYNSTSYRELPRHFHHVVQFVADAPEMRNQVVQRDTFFARERPRLRRVKCRVGKPHARSGNGRDHHSNLSGGISPQGNGTSFEDLSVRGNVLPGQRIDCREDSHAGGLLPREGAVEELQRCRERLRARARRDQHDHRSAKFSGDLAGDQRLGRIREPRQALARGSLAKRGNCRFERGVAADRRQRFRNRWENHAQVWRLAAVAPETRAAALRIFCTKTRRGISRREWNRNHASAGGFDFRAPDYFVERPIRTFDENIWKYASDQIARRGLIKNRHVVHRGKSGQYLGAILLRHQRTFRPLVPADAAITIDGDDQYVAEGARLRQTPDVARMQ